MTAPLKPASETVRLNTYQMTATEFKERMEQRFGEAGRGAQGKFWKGVGIDSLLSEKEKWMLEGKTEEELVSAIQ